MKNILFVGEHPLGSTGNSKMLRGVLDGLDYDQYQIACVGVKTSPIDVIPLMYNPFPFNIIEIDLRSQSYEDPWGSADLLNLVGSMKELDYLVLVGIDLWRYQNIYSGIRNLARQKGFKFVHFFPYDIQSLRSDWVDWINMIDFPFVYSQYGYKSLKKYCPGLEYFRPSFQMPEIWKPYTKEEKSEARRLFFPMLPKDAFIFGMIGPNQVRKDPQGHIRAFALIKEHHPNAYLYAHMDLFGSYNLKQYAEDCGLHKGSLLLKAPGSSLKVDRMPNLYSTFDVFMNCSLQEGLSWTTLEAMLCGIPVIASDSTAHPELLNDCGVLVDCKIPTYLRLFGKSGGSEIDALKCSPKDIAQGMEIMFDDAIRHTSSLAVRDKALCWLEHTTDINMLLKDVFERKPAQIEITQNQRNAILFAQHSAGGDVLMTTRCMKALKERHPGLELHYMTQPQYVGIVEEHPHVDMVIPNWDESQLKRYKYSYNPHGDRILPGHWGRNANSILADFYPKVLMIDDPDDFYVNMDSDVPVNIKGIPNICIVHTTGGDTEFRTYQYMADVCEAFRTMPKGYTTIQLGGLNDYPAGAVYDLRGLDYAKSAYIVNHAKLAITVDSYMSHIAGALGISQVVLFGSGNAAVCQPKQVKGELICLSPDYIMDCKGLGPCSAQVRECPVPCTGWHDPKTILRAVEELIKREREYYEYSGDKQKEF